MIDHVVGGVSVQRVPEGDDGETDQPERHGPFHCTTCPIAGLAHADDLAGVGEGLFDSPPRRITTGREFHTLGFYRAP